MNLSEATFRAAVTKLLMEELGAADAVTRTEGLKLFLEARESIGMKSAEVRLPDGGHIANATLPQPKARIAFVEDKFLALTEKDNPDEIVRSVNPAYKKAIERHLKIQGDEVIDTRTGEVVPWAAVRPAGQPKSFTITFTADGRDAVKEAWQQDPAKLLEFLAPPAIAAPVVEEPEVADPDDDMDLSELLDLRARQAATGGEGT